MKIVALVSDLMDRSRVSSALGAVSAVEFARDADACVGADVVVIDLARHGDMVDTVRTAAPGARVVAFGPHVDDELLERARRDGADVVLPRSRFFQDPAAVVTSG